MKLDFYFSLYTKINSEWVKDLKLKPETMKYVKENIGTKLMDLGHNDFYEFDSKGKGNKKQK